MEYPYLGPGASYDNAACMVAANGENSAFGLSSSYPEYNSCAHAQVSTASIHTSFVISIT